MPRINLLGSLSSEAQNLARIARALESLAQTQARSLKLALIQAGITPAALDEARAWEPREHPVATAMKSLRARWEKVTGKRVEDGEGGEETPAQRQRQPLVINQSGEDLAELRGLQPGSPEHRAAVARQLLRLRTKGSSPRPTALEDPYLEELIRAWGLVDDRIGGGPITRGQGDGALPPRPEEGEG